MVGHIGESIRRREDAPVGRAHPRLEGRDKVTGAARYAVEYPAEDVVYAWAVQSSVAKGRITRVDAADELGVSPQHVTISIGDSDLPAASVAGGSTGTSS